MPVNRNGDAALFWNGVLLEAMLRDSRKPANQQEQGGPTRASRAAAIVHAALHNAVNGVNRRNRFYYDPTTMQPPRPKSPPANASPEAAGAGAAHQALSLLYPDLEQATNLFDNELANFQALGLPGANDQPSQQYGAAVADEMLTARDNDGSDNGQYAPPAVGPGVWVPDVNLAPPGDPLTPHWGAVDLFLLDSVDRVLPGPFPALTSPDYTFAFRNVRDKGNALPPPAPRGRTPDETEIALFWAYDDLLGTPVRLYNQHAFQILNQELNPPVGVSLLHRHARLFALINIAMADAGIACWRSKFDPPRGFHVWRPFQGILGAGNDGNNDTVPDPNWLPLGRPRATDAQGNPVANTTPNFPAYVSGHSSFGSATFGMLRKFLGPRNASDPETPFPFDLTSEEVPNVVRSYVDRFDPTTQTAMTSWDQVIEENSLSRIFLGVHWWRDHTNGRPLGQQVSDYIWPSFLRPTT